jgi:hypothetical protein
MDISQSTKDYFESLKDRTDSYQDSLDTAKEFILDNEIENQEEIINYMIMSILWVAATRDEVLTEEDICIFLNIESTEEQEGVRVEIMDEMKYWTLPELLLYIRDTLEP